MSLMLYFSIQVDSFLKLGLGILKSVENNRLIDHYCLNRIMATIAIFILTKSQIF